MPPDLRTAILRQEVLWILVQPDGSASLAAPPQVPPSELRVGASVLSLKDAVGIAAGFQARMAGRGQAWLVVVSDPFERPEAVEGGEEARPLSGGERRVLADLGMDLPLGEWASAARLGLLEAGAGHPAEAAP